MYTENREATCQYPERHKGEIIYYSKIELKDWIKWFSNYWTIFFISALGFVNNKSVNNVYRVFMALQLFNILDFMVTFNTGWFIIYDTVITFTMFMCVILAGSIVYEYERARS